MKKPTRKEKIKEAAKSCTYRDNAWGRKFFCNGAAWADKNPYAKIWHKRSELNQFEGMMAYFWCKDYSIREVHYCGGMHFTYNDLPFDNDFMLFWCSRQDLLHKTNLNDLLDEIKELTE